MDWYMDMIGEHKIILEVVASLKKSASIMDQGEKLPPELIKDILDVIVNFADRCHHGKEENVLFPLLKKKPVNDKMMVDILLKEHEQARAYVKMMKSSMREEVLRGANGYTELLIKHIFKENKFFKECDALLSDKERESLLVGFEQIERDVMGEGRHEFYHKKADEIAKKAKGI